MIVTPQSVSWWVSLLVSWWVGDCHGIFCQSVCQLGVIWGVSWGSLGVSWDQLVGQSVGGQLGSVGRSVS